MRRAARPVFGLMPARQVPITAILCGAILVISLVGAILQRKLGFGLSTLSFSRDAIFNLELWRLVTYPFVESTFLGLLLGILVLWIFGGWFETAYGERDYLRFFVLSSIGAAVLAIPLSFIVNLVMPFSDPGMAEGPGAALDAMLVAFALANPSSNILFGFVLPIRARTVVFIILGLEVIRGIQSGVAGLSITLGGMAMGYLLVTGNWRPNRLFHRLHLKRLKKRRSSLYVVPPKDHTLN